MKPQRPEPTPRKRGRAGQRDRLRRLRRSDGLCERCAALGRTALATVVNHKQALVHGGPDEDWNTENLCRPCDLIVTAEYFGWSGQDRGVDAEGRPTTADHPWNAGRSSKPLTA